MTTAREASVRGVLLDVDDTLVDTRGAFTVAWRGVVAEYLPHLGSDAVGDVVQLWRADAAGHYQAYVAGRLDYEEQRRLRVNALHEHFGAAPVARGDFPRWNEAFEAGFRSGWAAFDDALAAVDDLRSAGVPVGVVTNAAAGYQQLKLEKIGLGDLPVLVGVDLFGFGKPDARVFHEGARRLGIAPGRAAYVGDELHADGLGAARAGLLGVWLDRPGTRGRPVGEDEIAVALDAGVRRIERLVELRAALDLP